MDWDVPSRCSSTSPSYYLYDLYDRPASPLAETKESDLSQYGSGYTPEQFERLRKIHQRMIEARRELDALIGDAYLRPRANIVPVHFLDLAAAVEKLRWAEKEWRELDRELDADDATSQNHSQAADEDEEPSSEAVFEAASADSRR
jgi:hypothetical protein